MVAPITNDRPSQFAPQRMAGQDAEIAANIGQYGTDRPAADLRRDLLGRRHGRQSCVNRVSGPCGDVGRAWPALRRGAAWFRFGIQRSGVVFDLRFERGGELQAAGDACEDQRDIVDTENGLPASPARRLVSRVKFGSASSEPLPAHSVVVVKPRYQASGRCSFGGR